MPLTEKSKKQALPLKRMRLKAIIGVTAERKRKKLL